MADVVVPSHWVGVVVARIVSSYAVCRYSIGSKLVAFADTRCSTSRAQKCKRRRDHSLQEKKQQ